jgi:hypothetical protein
LPQTKFPPARAADPPDGTAFPKIPQPDLGPADLASLARQICLAYTRNAHLKPDELSLGHVTAALGAIRDEARNAESNQTDAGLMLLEKIEALAEGIRQAPDPAERLKFLPPIDKFFRERGYRLPIEHFTRPPNNNRRGTKFNDALAVLS